MGYERSLSHLTNEILPLPDVRTGIDDPSNGLTTISFVPVSVG
jgi:hypothetical protein